MSGVVTDLPAVAGVPESVLSAAHAAALPADGAPAPWSLRLEAILWLAPAAEEALEVVAPALRGAHLPLSVGAFVRYLGTPVGPYHEVFGSPVILLPRGMPAMTVPFMVVDSLASIRGGRENWSLPKSLGAFTWRDDGATASGESPAGPWAVRARTRTLGPPVPAWAPGWIRQTTPDGRTLRIGARARGLARVCTVDVETEGPSLPSWLPAGRYPGVVVRRGHMRFGRSKVTR